jgi:hypothetical protein
MLAYHNLLSYEFYLILEKTGKQAEASHVIVINISSAVSGLMVNLINFFFL